MDHRLADAEIGGKPDLGDPFQPELITDPGSLLDIRPRCAIRHLAGFEIPLHNTKHLLTLPGWEWEGQPWLRRGLSFFFGG